MDIESITINAKQTAAMLGVSYWQILEMCKRGEIPFISIGKRRLFRQEVIERWLTERETSSIAKSSNTIS